MGLKNIVITYQCPKCGLEQKQEFDFSKARAIKFYCAGCGFENELTARHPKARGENEQTE